MTLLPRMKVMAPSVSMAWIAALRASLSERNVPRQRLWDF